MPMPTALEEGSFSLGDAVDRVTTIIKDLRQAENGIKSDLSNESGYQQIYIDEEARKNIYGKMDDGEWGEAKELANNSTDVGFSFQELVGEYMIMRLEQGREILENVGEEIESVDAFLFSSKQMEKNDFGGWKENVNEAIRKLEEIDKDEILNAQKRIGLAEQAFRKFEGSEEGLEIFEDEHRQANQLDKDIKSVEKELYEFVNQQKS